MAALVASAKRVASWVGRGAPALGGRELTRSARTTRPTSSVALSSSSQI